MASAQPVLDGDPVDLGTGLFVYDKVDLSMQGVPALNLVRTYRQNDTRSRAFGIGATHGYDLYLWSSSGYKQEVVLVLPHGGSLLEVHLPLASRALLRGLARAGGGVIQYPAALEWARWFSDLDQAIAESGCDVVDVCLPNFLHHRAVLIAARAGKHVIIEKPLALNLEEADEMIAACRSANRKLMYAEELCFAPKYERVRKLVPISIASAAPTNAASRTPASHNARESVIALP